MEDDLEGEVDQTDPKPSKRVPAKSLLDDDDTDSTPTPRKQTATSKMQRKYVIF